MSTAPARAAMIGARVMQVFTKTPNQWRDPKILPEEAERFRRELERLAIKAVVSHDSYLINLASPVRRLRAMSIKGFKAELTRCTLLGIPWVVSHPGNYMDDRDAGLKRNAAAYADCLAAFPDVGVLIEGTAGSGTALGSRFEELAQLRALMPAEIRPRVGFCVDTCHLYSAGYDLVNDWDGVWKEWDRLVGWDCLKCIHLNDSLTPFGSRRDRHAWIAEGSIGPEPFRRVMREERFAGVLKIIETPKEKDPVRHDRRMLRRLKAYALRAVAVLALAITAGTSAARAQTRVGVGGGVALMTKLAEDSIVQPFTVRPDLGPAINFWIESALNGRYKVAARFGTSWTHLTRHEADSTTEVTPLSTWTAAVTLSRSVIKDVAVYGKAGAIVYQADRDASNLFREGISPQPLLGAGITATHPLSNGLMLVIDFGYDVHRFSTRAMRDAGFSGERPVHRVGLTLGVSRGL